MADKFNPNAAVFVPGAGFHHRSPEKDEEPQDSWDERPDDAGEEPPKQPPPSEKPVMNGGPSLGGDNIQAQTPVTNSKPHTPEPEDEEDEDEVAAVRVKRISDAAKSGKDFVNIVFIGHVDAGKSTIGGQLMFLTGMMDKRTLEKYEREAREKNRESWALSWALDTNKEERDKGKTVEVGRAYFETDKKVFTVLDAPGHKSFVPNMIGGASQADVAVLVISARKGEFETGFERGGQTREHAMLVKTAGVAHLIVLVNKMDDPTVNWDQQRYNDIHRKLSPYLKQVGFKSDVPFIPCSGLMGSFIKDAPEPNPAPWYNGMTFISYLDTLPAIDRNRDGAVRIPILDKYSDMGTIVLGKVESGSACKGDTLIMMPNRVQVQVLQVWSNDDEADEISSGENVKLKLKGIEEDDILPGFVLCSIDNECCIGRIFDCEVFILEYKSIISSGYSCVLHIHSAVEEVTVRALISVLDKKTGEWSKTRPRFVKQDQKCRMRLESNETFCIEPFSKMPQLGRFSLRDEGKTLAIGKVLKVVK